MAVKIQSFGKTENGVEVTQYTITNGKGTECSLIDLGAAWVTMKVRDRKGAFADVVIGYDNAEAYYHNPTSCGECVGRNANRIGGAAFELEGVRYQLAKNNNENNLHSGPDKWVTHLFKGSLPDGEAGNSVRFTKFSPDGEQGFPGNLDFSVTYTLTEEDALRIVYEASADQTTVINPTNHAYFNLAGNGSGDILQQEVWINADAFTPADQWSIPTGEIRPVAGTPFDFTQKKKIGRDIGADYDQLKFAGGYDHNFALNEQGTGLRHAALLTDPVSGRRMDVYTDLPGMQFYTGNGLKNTYPGKDGADYLPRTGVCFETQYYPDAVNKPDWQQPVFKKGQVYRSETVYSFSVE